MSVDLSQYPSLLSPDEARELARCEAVIEPGLDAFVEVGSALIKIRDSQLYRQNYSTFERYCRERWGLARATAYRLIDASGVVINVSNWRQSLPILPTSESQVRPLVRLAPSQQIEVWTRAVETAPGGKPTAKDVEDVATELFPKKRKGRKNSSHESGSVTKFPGLIKPMDNWNFSPVLYERIDGEDGHGYIPGDLYANCFWYYSRPDDVFADIMAGSGMAWHVYLDLIRWMKAEYRPQLKEVLLFDLHPRGRYLERICQHDARDPFPVDRINYAFADVPYFGKVIGQYGSSPDDLANQRLGDWSDSLYRIARNLSLVQRDGDRATIISPNHSEIDKADAPYVMVVPILLDAFHRSGYTLYHMVAQSRRIQQAQSIQMANTNNKAKAKRVMLSDISYVLTFTRNGIRK